MDPYRILGFAFASADLLFEVDTRGTIAFAVGAADQLGLREGDLIGRACSDLFSEPDRPMVQAFLAGVGRGRAGPVTVALMSSDGAPRFASLSACRLSPTANLSCALGFGAPVPLTARAAVAGDGYQERREFETLAKSLLAAAATLGQELDIALIDLPGLSTALVNMGPTRAKALLDRFAGALRAEAFAGAPAARLTEERFAVIRNPGVGADLLDQRLTGALAEEGLTPTSQVLAVDVAAGSLERSLRAMRFAVEAFTERGPAGVAGASLNEAFTRSVQRTLAEAGEFGAVIKARRFNLVFQPIVSLATGACAHFETLVRFQDDDTSPYKLIRMAEDLDLILELDLAIAEQTLGRLRNYRHTDLKLAINISGRSVMDAWFISELRRMTSQYDVDPARLIFEVTESVAIDNLVAADKHIQELRGDGHKVCVDDFGAGASSYPYLQKLHVDVIKIDGRYVTELVEGGRDAALVRHLVGLCRELGVATVAEMVSSQAIEDVLRTAGVDFGQGFYYAPPAPDPKYAPKIKVNARRSGEREQWG